MYMWTTVKHCRILSRLEAGVYDAGGLEEKAGGLRRGLGAEEDCHGQKSEDRGQDVERSAGALVHFFGSTRTHRN